MSNLKMYKLITGEVVICPVLTSIIETDEYYTASKPLQLILSPGPDGFSMALIPWMTSKTYIRKDSVLAFSDDIPSPVEQQYIKMTTNIQIANGINTSGKGGQGIQLVR